jgi:hypothetical protein
VGTRDGVDDIEKKKCLTLQGLELRILGRPASRYNDCASSGIEHATIRFVA